MRILKSGLLWAYAATALVHLAAKTSNQQALSAWTKPWLMPLLMGWFVVVAPKKSKFLRSSLVAGLTFSTVGDILLLFSRGPHGNLSLRSTCLFMCPNLLFGRLLGGSRAR